MIAAASRTRILAILQRYLVLHRRSLIRVFDICFWPVMDLLIWGFLALYLQSLSDTPIARLAILLIGALIAWDIHYRGQQAVTISLMEEIWTKNIVNMLISPARLWEWITATFLYSTLKVAAVTLILAVLARVAYAFDIGRVGWEFMPLSASLLFFGWSIGLLTAGILLRFGHAAEALIWGIPFLIQPFSCVFYPVSSLPGWARWLAHCLPSTYAFEGLRMALQDGYVPGRIWLAIAGLNAGYFALGTLVLIGCFRHARLNGRLSRLGQE